MLPLDQATSRPSASATDVQHSEIVSIRTGRYIFLILQNPGRQIRWARLASPDWRAHAQLIDIGATLLQSRDRGDAHQKLHCNGHCESAGAHERPSIDLAMQVGSAHRNSSCRLNTLWHGPSPADVMTVTKMRFCRGGRRVCPYSAQIARAGLVIPARRNIAPAAFPAFTDTMRTRTQRSVNGHCCREMPVVTA